MKNIYGIVRGNITKYLFLSPDGSCSTNSSPTFDTFPRASSDRTAPKKRFPFPSNRRRNREREREVATQGKEVPSRPRTGPDFISCAFVFRSDYSRGHKRKIRYVQDTSYYNYVKDPVTYGGRTRIRSSLPCSTLPPFAPSYPHRCPRPLGSPSCLPLVTSCSRFGRKFARIRRIRKSGSSRTSTGEPVGRAHARLTICRI